MITTIKIRNFCGISFIEMECAKFNLICGSNMQGKTTLIEAIKWAVLGGNEDFYIKNGESECEVTLTTDSGIRVQRTKLRGGTSKLYVFKNDKTIDKPQDALNKVYNEFMFNPMAMLSMKKKEQAEFISSALSKKLVITDELINEWNLHEIDKEELKKDPVKAIEAYKDKQYNSRTEVNRILKQLESSGAVKFKKEYVLEDKTETEEALKQISDKLNAAIINNAKYEASRKNQDSVASVEATVNLLSQEIANLEINGLSPNDLVKLNEEANSLDKQIKEIENTIITNRTVYKNISETLEKLKDGQPQCPIKLNIKCTTDFSSSVEELKKDLEEKGNFVREKTTEGNNLKLKLQEIRKNIENLSSFKSKQLELERANSLLANLSVEKFSYIDTQELENNKKTLEAELAEINSYLSFKQNNGIEEVRKRQEELDNCVKNLDKVIQVNIPSKLQLGVQHVQITKDGIYFRGLPLYRESKSVQLRVCTAILKDLFPSSTLYTLDELETIDAHNLKKYIENSVNSNDNIQYFGTLVGYSQFSMPNKAKAFVMKSFKIEA